MTTTTTTVTTTVTTTTAAATPTKARLIFVLDRSGSMQSIQNEAIGGFNAFVEAQKKVEGEATLSLVIFDNVIDTIHKDVPLNEVPVLTSQVFVPRGMTAMNDAIGVTITQCLSETAEAGVKTIMAVLTDGQENASKEYTGKMVGDLIKRAESEYGWEVLFLGANIDVNAVASSINIASNKFATFQANAKGAMDSYDAVSNATAMYRSGVSGQSVNLSAELTKSATLSSQNSK